MTPEAWLCGPVEGIHPLLMPVAHALVQARRDLEVARDLNVDELWARPGGAASVGFHLRHIPGSMNRLLTYAAGRQLDEDQMARLESERDADAHSADAPDAPDAPGLLEGVDREIERALDVLRQTPEADLLTPREVGRGRLPSNVLGLLFHVAEHTQRHAGQVVTTVKVVRGARGIG